MTPRGDFTDMSSDPLLLVAARRNEEAFARLITNHLRELHVHCYRLLGSLHDAEDAVQETLLRAWRHLDQCADDTAFRAWLYRIATNACLTLVRRRRSAQRPALSHTAEAPPRADTEEGIAYTPYPDAWLDQLDIASNPAARYDLRESVRLAFIAAVQLLPPRQRAALLLCDVLGWSVREVAPMLETSVSAVTSALQRARASLQRQRVAGLLTEEEVTPP